MSRQEEHISSEASPLLHTQDEAEARSIPESPASRWQARHPATIVLLIALIKFGVTLSGMMIIIPIYRLIEDALCHVYYQDDTSGIIEELQCKVDEVQSNLAFLIGWLGLVTSIMSMLTLV